ncbi:hypothetical protein Pdw03_4979 [Penicillium digitatum]|uniref:Uncharacterized protein n=1 Tax=Penicillium digitatum TaxID=36651 RepID=A0A7T7BJI7_PENDI|nr:hypothetical protein Pdw03_4979 [Penicillium digitatum]
MAWPGLCNFYSIASLVYTYLETRAVVALHSSNTSNIHLQVLYLPGKLFCVLCVDSISSDPNLERCSSISFGPKKPGEERKKRNEL